jgi:hypothetical protein
LRFSLKSTIDPIEPESDGRRGSPSPRFKAACAYPVRAGRRRSERVEPMNAGRELRIGEFDGAPGSLAGLAGHDAAWADG